MKMTSDELIDQLGKDFYEVKQLVSGGFVAYSTNFFAKGETMKEALENLLALIKSKEVLHG